MFKTSWLLILFAGWIFSGCQSQGLQNSAMMRGFNLLQHRNVAWNSPEAQKSLKRIASLGANAVVFIPFLEQDNINSLVVRQSEAVTNAQLQGGIRYARKLGLRVILKPQMLVHGAWAGAIRQPDVGRWQEWFYSYSRQIIRQARFAQREGVKDFVIGTELSQTTTHVDWPWLIKRLRGVFHGRLTYVAHNVEGIARFPHWHLLDAVSLTLYPSLGTSGEALEIQQHISQAITELHAAVENIDRPLWVMEIGMPSAHGASARPWEWQHLEQAKADMTLQSNTLDIWLKSLDRPWIDGVFIWAWYSDSSAGGTRDADFTPQNKPAERIIRRYWNG